MATPALGLQPDGSRVWRVQVGGGSEADLIEYNGFFPKQLTVNAGDTVFFDFKALHNPHTVTFLSGQEAPPLVVPADEGTPTAGAATAEAGIPKLMFNPAAAFPTEGTTYDGSGIASSGLNVLRPPDQPFTLTFSAPGTFDYLCLVHPLHMKGTVTVQEAGAPVPHEQADVDALAADEMAKALAEGKALLAEYAAAATPSAGPGGGNLWDVQAGADDHEAVLLRYLPDQLTIKAGDTVRWTDRSEVEPHTVTFLGGEAPPDLVVPEPQAGGPPKLVFNPAVVAPAGPEVYSGQGYANSGALGADFGKFTGLTTYELTFDTPGEYPYFCVLHGSPTMGMRGTVTVT
jgi:plastocyanin